MTPPRTRKPRDANRIPEAGTGKLDHQPEPTAPRPAAQRTERQETAEVDLDEIRRQLATERDTAIADLRDMGVIAESDPAGPRAAAEAVLDVGDAAQASERRDLSATTRERLANRINRLTAALERIDEGTYGQCSICGGSIGAPRLAAIPEADTCRDCQEQRERAEARSRPSG